MNTEADHLYPDSNFVDKKPRIDFGLWLLRVFVWDSILPAFVVLVPCLIKFVLPNNRGAVEIASLVIPVGAFLFRFYVGRRYICSNKCSELVRRVQLGFLCVGIFQLIILDALMILMHIMPKGALIASKEDCFVFALIYFTYLAPMVIAMYPGKSYTHDEELESDYYRF